MLEFVNSFKSSEAMLEFLKAIKERSATAKQRAESMPKLSKKARATSYAPRETKGGSSVLGSCDS